MQLDFNKGNGLIPVIIQDSISLQVLMLGYMNTEAYDQTLSTGKVTFYSRSKQRLWTKGESSGNYLLVQTIAEDCDQDSLLIKAVPCGPTCHTGSYACFGNRDTAGTLYRLEQTIDKRLADQDQNSYSAALVAKGINKVAQKVGEEAVELVIEAMSHDRDLLLGEAADLLYHTILLLKAKGYSIKDVETVLQERER